MFIKFNLINKLYESSDKSTINLRCYHSVRSKEYRITSFERCFEFLTLLRLAKSESKKCLLCLFPGALLYINRLILIIFVLLSYNFLLANDGNSKLKDTVKTKLILKPDTVSNNNLYNKNLKIQDTIKSDTSGFKMQKSSTGALLRSLIFPGWGQLYVHNYWKAPIFAGACGALIGGVIFYNNKYKTAKNELNSANAEATPDLNKIAILKNERDFYQTWRDEEGFYFLAVYILAAVDAYTGAHLYDFSVSDDISINFAPSVNNTGLSIVFSYKFK